MNRPVPPIFKHLPAKLLEGVSKSRSGVENRRASGRKSVIRQPGNPDDMRHLANFVRFASRCHVVYGLSSNTPYSPTQTLAWLASLSKSERQQLVADFLSSEELLGDILPVVFEGLTAGTNLSRQSDFIKASMMQIALGNEDIATYSLRFGSDFMVRAGNRKHESITQVINKAVKASLASVWKKNNLDGLVPAPSYWHVLDYPDAIPEERGPGGFHIHGEIVTPNGILRYVREAMELASNGYASEKRYRNKVVHFGEPSHDFSNRGGKRENCLSDYPSAVRAAGGSYHFQQPWYCHQKIDRARAAGTALGIDIGNGWGWSRGVYQEAEACLGIFKVLTDGLPTSA